jgi:hypothetical protein
MRPLGQVALVRAARFLDPTQFRVFYESDAGRACEDANLILRLVDDVFARQRRLTSASVLAGIDTRLAELSTTASGLNGWPSIDLLRAIDGYIKADKNDAVDALDWWRAHAESLRPLDIVARWFLCIPATSAESERTFSLSGLVVSPLRTRLSGDRVHTLTLLASALRRRTARFDAAAHPPPRAGSSAGGGQEAAVVVNDDAGSGAEEPCADEGDEMESLLEDGVMDFDVDNGLTPAVPSVIPGEEETET